MQVFWASVAFLVSHRVQLSARTLDARQMSKLSISSKIPEATLGSSVLSPLLRLVGCVATRSMSRRPLRSVACRNRHEFLVLHPVPLQAM